MGRVGVVSLSLRAWSADTRRVVCIEWPVSPRPYLCVSFSSQIRKLLARTFPRTISGRIWLCRYTVMAHILTNYVVP